MLGADRPPRHQQPLPVRTHQAAATAPLLLLGPDRAWVVMLLVATFAGGVANLVVIVGFMVTATSGLPDEEQGLATGIATLSQQVGITVGIPAMSAVVAAVVRSFDTESVDTVLSGVTAAIAVNAGGCLVGALLAGLLLPAPPDTRATPADPLPSVSPPRGPGLP